MTCYRCAWLRLLSNWLNWLKPDYPLAFHVK